MPLRSDQLSMAHRLGDALRAGHRRPLQQAPTAYGKSHLIAHLIALLAGAGHHVLFLSHLEEINLDIVQRTHDAGVGAIALQMGDHPIGSADARVTFASIQTVTRRGLRPRADFIFIDEAHRVAASSYQRIGLDYPEARFIGATATPERPDGRPLTFFDVLLPGPHPLELVEAGIIAPIVTYAPAKPGPALAQDPVEAWPLGPSGAPRPGVLFAKNVQHSLDIARRFAAERGFAAVHIEGDTPNREALLARFNGGGGEVDILCCYRLLTEGVNTVRSEVTMAACSFGHPGAALQAIGRSRRVRPGKTQAWFYDLTDNVSRLGLPDDERTYHLEGRAIRLAAEGAQAIPVRACPACLAWSRAGRACPWCGAALPPVPPPRLSKRELVEQMHARQRLEGAEWEEWSAWVRGRRAKGRTPLQIVHGWAFAHGGRKPRYTVAQVPVEGGEERASA